ncbi:hypothetical protein [Rubinisphaera sp.]|uniref:hypothetical protein n=1 Tax=Rubinisphaera sp. TaxID=2024857 RepID=UPI000C0FEEFF|nr:hypothetical protein [Rubinisphaera sp.]MBV08789.1 hypothetical protein [Rubinisphaera sp.]HCS52384.1 hypothetical protein [Planctomycetaceae bacterium]|tara:strand:- start:6287 stop:8401 length:2115 start_codon:yes stop_codon:yes gene_type:complete
MANIKSMLSADGIKHFALKHTEKVVFGLVCLFVVLTLAGTQWSTYSKPPGLLEQELQVADNLIANSTWNEDERAKFPPVEVDEQVKEMLVGITDSPYRWDAEFMYPPTGSDDPRREPEFVMVAALKADSGRTILAQSTTVASETEMESTEPEPVTTEPKEDLGLDDIASRPTARPEMAGDAANPYAGGDYYEEYSVSNSYDEMVVDYDAEMGGEYGSGMSLPSNVKGVPVRYVSVRGIFDLRKQVSNYSKALSIPESEAEKLVRFMDFKLERQKSDSSDGPWSEWEPVDIQVAMDYLNQTVDYDADVVSAGVRNPVITMPLPARLMGVWRNKVNHPNVKNFELSPEELEYEETLNRKILEEHVKNNKKIKQRAVPGGFQKIQLDVTSMQQEYLNETDSRQLNRVFETEFKGTSAEIRKKLIEKIKAQVSAAGNLVLFRYIDFDIEAGKAYRYRVSLVLSNPNYDVPIDQVVDPSVAQGAVRETPFSQPSDVAVVSPDYAYFVRRVSPPRGISNEIADMQIFQWYDSGTMIKGNLSMEPGDYIGGMAKTHVLRPAEMTYEVEEDVEFKTDDLIVDALVINKLDYNLHKDLTLPKTLTRGDVGVTPEVLVVDSSGNLKSLDPLSYEGARVRYDEYYEGEKGPFEMLKDASKKMSETSGLDALLDGEDSSAMEMEMMMQMDAGPSRLRDRRGNPTRRQSPTSSSAGP